MPHPSFLVYREVILHRTPEKLFPLFAIDILLDFPDDNSTLLGMDKVQKYLISLSSIVNRINDFRMIGDVVTTKILSNNSELFTLKIKAEEDDMHKICYILLSKGDLKVLLPRSKPLIFNDVSGTSL